MLHVQEMAVVLYQDQCLCIYWQKTKRRPSGNGQLWCHQLYWRASLAGGGARNFCASVPTSDDGCACSAPGNKIILTTDEGRRQVLAQLCIYAVTFISYRFICSWHIMNFEVLCQNNYSGDWILSASQTQTLFTTLRWSRWLLWPGDLSLRCQSCHHCRSQQQMCSCLNWSKICISSSAKLDVNVINSNWQPSQIQPKIWPVPDLAGFAKTGRMPDLPEPGLRAGPSLDDTKLLHQANWNHN